MIFNINSTRGHTGSLLVIILWLKIYKMQMSFSDRTTFGLLLYYYIY